MTHDHYSFGPTLSIVVGLLLLVVFAPAASGQTESQGNLPMKPRLELGNSPINEVSLGPLDLGQTPIFKEYFPLVPEKKGTEDLCMVLLNHSQRAIVGLAVQWVVTDAAGRVEARNTRSHSFISPGFAPLANPGENLLVCPPQSVVPEAPLHGKGRIVWHTSSRAIEFFSTATHVRADIDSLIFSDGEVVGPNLFGLPAEIRASKKAVDLVVGRVHSAAAKALEPADASSVSPTRIHEFLKQIDGRLPADHPVANELRLLRSERVDRDINMDRNSFVLDLLSTLYFKATLEYYESVPAPPDFHRKDGTKL